MLQRSSIQGFLLFSGLKYYPFTISSNLAILVCLTTSFALFSRNSRMAVCYLIVSSISSTLSKMERSSFGFFSISYLPAPFCLSACLSSFYKILTLLFNLLNSSSLSSTSSLFCSLMSCSMLVTSKDMDLILSLVQAKRCSQLLLARQMLTNFMPNRIIKTTAQAKAIAWIFILLL